MTTEIKYVTNNLINRIVSICGNACKQHNFVVADRCKDVLIDFWIDGNRGKIDVQDFENLYHGLKSVRDNVLRAKAEYHKVNGDGWEQSQTFVTIREVETFDITNADTWEKFDKALTDLMNVNIHDAYKALD
jgi:hypothetical protein